MVTIGMKLDKAAKSGGGDRYAGQVMGEEINIYLPQSVSRKDGVPAQEVTLSIEVK